MKKFKISWIESNSKLKNFVVKNKRFILIGSVIPVVITPILTSIAFAQKSKDQSSQQNTDTIIHKTITSEVANWTNPLASNMDQTSRQRGQMEVFSQNNNSPFSVMMVFQIEHFSSTKNSWHQFKQGNFTIQDIQDKTWSVRTLSETQTLTWITTN